MRFKCFRPVLLVLVGCATPAVHVPKTVRLAADQSLQTQQILVEQDLPAHQLRRLEFELDSLITADQCYAFLHSPDSSRFLALFAERRDHPSFDRMERFGRTAHVFYQADEVDSIYFGGYALWGLNLNGHWYYSKEIECDFWDLDKKSARKNYTYYALKDEGYFTTRSKVFWANGGESGMFKVVGASDRLWPEIEGLPEIVGWHNVAAENRKRQLSNAAIEAKACNVYAQLWQFLQQTDSLAHEPSVGRYSGRSCMHLYNSDRNKVLLPVAYYDVTGSCWLRYFYAEIAENQVRLYEWMKFPLKRIEREKGAESLQVVYDLRTMLPGFNWGTNHMIRNSAFWQVNFETEYLLLSQYQVK